jgi:2-keto-3-deoxy-L-rhamnonate aldolase RhmA
MEVSGSIARQRMERGEVAIGIGVKFARTVDIAKAMRAAGYDWLFIDLEHGSMSLDTASQIALAALDVGVTPLVRVPNGEFGMATRILDNGAMGIVMPHVDTADEAREIVSKLKFPPVGHRSVSSGLPHLDYKPLGMRAIAETLNAAMLLVVMLESPEAIANAEEIAAVPGIDVLLVGSNDLCAEMGIAGDYGNPRLGEAVKQVVAACEKHGKWPGFAGVYDEALMPRYLELGPKFVLCGTDISLMISAASKRSAFVRRSMDGSEAQRAAI